jgi:uroporphyrinogen decarboxylase
MGLFEHFWPETIRDYWVHHGYPQDTDPQEYFDYDIMFGGGWINMAPFKDVNETVEESAEWMLVRNGLGATMRYWKHKSGTPEHVDFDCITPERWETKYKPQLLKFDPSRVNIEETKANLEKAHAKGKFCHYGGLHVFELLRATLGDVVMLESLALEPEWIHDFCTTYNAFIFQHLDYLFDNAGQPDGAFIYEDLGYNKGLFCSPNMYRELIMPYHQQLFDYFHNRNMPEQSC